MATRAESGQQDGPEPELVYVDQNDTPGIVRYRKGKGFAYLAPDGHWLSSRHPQDRAHLKRIRSLAIPPAYTAVWISPEPLAHIQATARDARGRKQYRYHPDWSRLQDEQKFRRMHEFGHALPALRERVNRDLSEHGGVPTRNTVLATLVRLLDTTHMRIGNEAYTRENRSYGLSTLRNRHVEVAGHQVKLKFRGKSGIWHDVALQDRRVARIVKRCQALPGQILFQYIDDEQRVHNLGSAEVNEYIRQASGGPFSAKDFRTWHATVHAWSLLAPDAQTSTEAPAEAAASTQADRARQIKQALKEVAAGLGNTEAVCRKSYVHPWVLQCALQGNWPASSDAVEAKRGPELELTEPERSLLWGLSKAVPT